MASLISRFKIRVLSHWSESSRQNAISLRETIETSITIGVRLGGRKYNFFALVNKTYVSHEISSPMAISVAHNHHV
jgi:hypothetical protein